MMKKPARLLALILALALIAGSLAACSKGGSQGDSSGGDTSGGSDKEVYKLTFTTHGTTNHAYAPALIRWRDALYEESDGRLDIQMYFGGTLASATDEVNVVQQGGADLCWSTNSLAPALFKYCGIIGAYGDKVTNTYIGTHTMLEMYKNIDAISSEFTKAGLKALAYHTQTPSCLGGKGNKIVNPSDFKGVSIQSISKNTINILDSFGAAVIGVSVPDLYENFSKNVCTAALIDSALYSEMKLNEVIDYFNTFNYNSSVGFVVMNQSKFDSLPADLQQLLESKFEWLSMEIAKDTNDYFRKFVTETLPANNVEVYDCTDEMIKANKEKLQSVVVGPFRELCKEGGYNADEIMSSIEKYLEDARNKYGPEYDWFAKS